MPTPPGDQPATWEEYVKTVGAALKERRLAAGLQQDKLAAMAGIARFHYQQLEYGAHKPGEPANPTLKVLVRLALALKCEVADLLPGATALELD